MSKKIMQQALDSFEAIMFEKDAESCQIIAKNARYSLREALAQPELFKPDWVSYRQGVADGAAQPEQDSNCNPSDLCAGCRCAYSRLAQPEQEPVNWLTLQPEAQAIVEGKYLFKRFIDGTPLANDIAVWMTEFALKYTTPHSAKGLADSAETFGKPDIGLPDPCPQCRKGGVCRTPKCGRLQLPAEHPYRNQALAQPEQEPVTWMTRRTDDGGVVISGYETCEPTDYDAIPVYAAPPKRQWVGLTEDEIKKIMQRWRGEFDIRDIERLLKEKNT